MRLVIKIGGAGVDTPHTQTLLWQAIRRAHALLDGQLVLVHGGGRAVDAHLERLGFTTTRIDGLRVTPLDQVDEITAVLAGRVNKSLVAALNHAHTYADDESASRRAHPPQAPAVGLCLADANLLPTAPFDPRLQRVGKPIPQRSDLLELLLEHRYLPVISSIGFGPDALALNINADDAAAGLAQALHASALVLLTDVPAVLDKNKQPIRELTAADIDRLIADGTISAGMVPKVRAALAAATAAKAPAYIASWNRPEDLIALAQGKHIGTKILSP